MNRPLDGLYFCKRGMPRDLKREPLVWGGQNYCMHMGQCMVVGVSDAKWFDKCVCNNGVLRVQDLMGEC